MSNDVNYYLNHPEEGIKYFTGIQTSHQELVKKFSSLKDNSEFEGMYLRIKELIEKYNNYYNDIVVANSDLEEMENHFRKNEITVDRYDLQKTKNKNKLLESFQKLLEIDANIKEIDENRVKGANEEKKIKSVQALIKKEEPREEIQRLQKELDKVRLDLKWTKQHLDELKNNIMELEDSTIRNRLLGF